jgi:hypothetical protein
VVLGLVERDARVQAPVGAEGEPVEAGEAGRADGVDGPVAEAPPVPPAQDDEPAPGADVEPAAARGQAECRRGRAGQPLGLAAAHDEQAALGLAAHVRAGRDERRAAQERE